MECLCDKQQHAQRAPRSNSKLPLQFRGLGRCQMESEQRSGEQQELELCMADSGQIEGWVRVPQPEYWRFLLTEVKFSQMISAYATSEAAKPEMWGGKYPDQSDADQLAACFAFEWTEALEQMLRHWEYPPTTTGYWFLELWTAARRLIWRARGSVSWAHDCESMWDLGFCGENDGMTTGFFFFLVLKFCVRVLLSENMSFLDTESGFVSCSVGLLSLACFPGNEEASVCTNCVPA